MKRFITFIAILTSAFLMLIVTIRQSVAEHSAQAASFASEGLYDEALMAYHQSSFYMNFLGKIVHLFGEFNAFLAILGVFLVMSGLLLRPATKGCVKQIRITAPFQADEIH